VPAPSGGGRATRLFGRDPRYGEVFDLFEKAGGNVERATAVLAELVREWPEGAERRHDLVDLEHEGDRITHDIVHHLHTRSFAPLDQRDVLALASGVDDVVDYAEEVADFLGLYKVEAPTDQAIELAEVLSDSGREISTALRSLRAPEQARGQVIKIKQLEETGDRIEREGLTSLFDGGIDPMLVIRWKDIYERLEQGIDACDRVGRLISGIAVKQG
jgi:predicted phosphate transport protein (TIGR00153 family)